MPIVTIHDVARRAGCSAATVSRVLNGRGPVGEAMLGRVRRALAELHYGGGPAVGRAGGVPRGARRAVGVLVPSLTNPIFAASLGGMQDRLRLAGYAVVIAQSNYDPAGEAEAVAALLAERPAGLVATLCDVATSTVPAAAMPPTVLLYNEPTERFPAAVTVDNRRAARELVDRLIAAGHRRVLFVSGHFAASDRARRRYEGYCDAMAAAGLPVAAALEIGFVDGVDNVDLTEALDGLAPTAIVASNDLLALRVVAAARRHGLAVPEALSVAGFDGMAIGQLLSPALTTVEVPDATMGVAAASLLLDMIENAAPARHIRVDHRLRWGETTRSLVA